MMIDEVAPGRKPTLYMMVGLPYSGKTTFARTLGYPIVSPNCIRYEVHGERYVQKREDEVWRVAHYMVGALFRAGHKGVVLDATSITKAQRNGWSYPDRWEREFMCMTATQEICVQRAIDNKDEYIVPVILKMAAEIESIGLDECGR